MPLGDRGQRPLIRATSVHHDKLVAPVTQGAVGDAGSIGRPHRPRLDVRSNGQLAQVTAIPSNEEDVALLPGDRIKNKNGASFLEGSEQAI